MPLYPRRRRTQSCAFAPTFVAPFRATGGMECSSEMFDERPVLRRGNTLNYPLPIPLYGPAMAVWPGDGRSPIVPFESREPR